jgi:hypothetical protein
MVQVPPGFCTTAQAARISGVHHRTLLRWIERKAIAPTWFGSEGKGGLYGWTLRDLAAAGAIRRMRVYHSTHAVHRAVAALQAYGADLAGAAVVSDAQGIYRVLPTGDLVELMTGGQIRAVALAPLLSELREHARRLGVDLFDQPAQQRAAAGG